MYVYITVSIFQYFMQNISVMTSANAEDDIYKNDPKCHLFKVNIVMKVSQLIFVEHTADFVMFAVLYCKI